MKLLIVHYHLRPGGVRRVIESATPHLVARWPERIRGVVLATGEAPDPHWLRCFRRQLPRTPVTVFHEPAFGYVAESRLKRSGLSDRVYDAVNRLVVLAGPGQRLVWAHNLALGRNLYLARALTQICGACCVPLVAHHHDWWFENRWHHFAAMREPGFCKLDAVAGAVLRGSRWVSHVAINRADGEVLERHFPGLGGWLPNLVERPAPPGAGQRQAAAAWLNQQLGEAAPVWLLPCRLLRRKNVAEAMLLTRWLRPEAWLVTTGGASSSEEQPYADALAAAARSQGWRLRLGVLQGDESGKPTVPELLAASETVVLTSLQEGFGLPYLEAAASGRPLVARALPNIAPDLKSFGFVFPQAYREVLIDPTLFDWDRERERQARLFAAWKDLMPRAASGLAGSPAVLAAGDRPCPVAFIRLTLTAQLEVLACPVAVSWERCVPLNPFLRRWRARAVAGGLKVSPWPRSAGRWLGGFAYVRRFLELLPWGDEPNPRTHASKRCQAALLGRKLRAEFLYPLLWNIVT